MLHHVPHVEAPLAPAPDLLPPDAPELSTAQAGEALAFVDDSSSLTELPLWRLGLVLPKKLARRSVTRSLLRHQIRASVSRYAPAVAVAGWGPDHPGDAWVVRLRAPFDRKQFPSAASEALNREVRLELDALWDALCAKKPPVAVSRSP